MGAHFVNILKTIELQASKWWILWYVNYGSILKNLLWQSLKMLLKSFVFKEINDRLNI
jgi:hypothetical protein